MDGVYEITLADSATLTCTESLRCMPDAVKHTTGSPFVRGNLICRAGDVADESDVEAPLSK